MSLASHRSEETTTTGRKLAPNGSVYSSQGASKKDNPGPKPVSLFFFQRASKTITLHWVGFGGCANM